MHASVYHTAGRLYGVLSLDQNSHETSETCASHGAKGLTAIYHLSDRQTVLSSKPFCCVPHARWPDNDSLCWKFSFTPFPTDSLWLLFDLNCERHQSAEPVVNTLILNVFYFVSLFVPCFPACFLTLLSVAQVAQLLAAVDTIASGKTPNHPTPAATTAAVEPSVAGREEPNGTHATENGVANGENAVETGHDKELPLDDDTRTDIPRKEGANIGVVPADSEEQHVAGGGGDLPLAESAGSAEADDTPVVGVRGLCVPSAGSGKVFPSSEVPLSEGERVEKSEEQSQEQDKNNDSSGGEQELRVADDTSVVSATDEDWIKISPPANTEAFFPAAAAAPVANGDLETSPEGTVLLDTAVAARHEGEDKSRYPGSDGTSLTSHTLLLSRAATRVCRLWELVGSTGEVEAWAALARGERHRACRRLADYAATAGGLGLLPAAGVDCCRDGVRLCHSAFGCLAIFGRVSPAMWADLALPLPEQSARDKDQQSEETPAVTEHGIGKTEKHPPKEEEHARRRPASSGRARAYMFCFVFSALCVSAF